MDRLEKAAKHCGQTKQAFIQTSVLAEIAEVEERRRMKMLRNPRAAAFHPMSSQDDDSTTSVGSGLADILRQQREAREPVQAPPQQQGQVVVNVGNGGGSGTGGTIENLATYIVEGKNFERARRMQIAVEVLRTAASTDEERKVLAARLDEAIASKSKTQTAESGGVVRAAKMAYDKIADLLR